MSISRTKSEELFKTANTYFPGGVNSPVRAFKAVNGSPLFIERGDGGVIQDADGNEFIDFCGSWGPLILGHNNAEVKKATIETIEKGTSFGAPTLKENELAELILANHDYIEKIRFVNSGTEAVMSAIRLARGCTGKSKIIKFEGCYHGHSDGLLVSAGSGLATLGTSSSNGVPDSFAQETIVLPLNNKMALLHAFDKYEDEIACVIIEPIPANNGLLLQDLSFLELLRELCDENESLLIFDEVISGFRVRFDGAAGFYDIAPDIITFGKIIGGGLPVGAYASSEKIMANIAPEGGVYQAGTLSGNPVAMAAGIAQLKECLKSGFYEGLEHKTHQFTHKINRHIITKGYNANIVSIGSIFWLSFSKNKIQSADAIEAASMDKFKVFYDELLQQGIYVGPSGYEVGFVSAAHTQEQLDTAAEAFCNALDVVFG